MLVVVSTRGVRLDAGSVALVLGWDWTRAGRDVLFIDADVDATALAERCGTAMRASYSPASRGVPSLIAAADPLTLESVATHSYSIGDPDGSLWLLFAPFNAAGAAYAASWLAERADDLLALSARRRVVVSSALSADDERLLPLLRTASTVVILGVAGDDEQVEGLRTQCRDAGLLSVGSQHRLLLLEGSSHLDDDEFRAATGLHVVGRLPVVDDERVLRLVGGRKAAGGGRRVKRFADRLGAVAAALESLVDAERTEVAADAFQPALRIVPGPVAASPAVDLWGAAGEAGV